eukprot:g29770.t1
MTTRHAQAGFDMSTSLDEYCFPGTPRAHHELDGYVHTDPHDAFDLSNVKGSSRSVSSEELNSCDSSSECLDA